ncbi:MULTISPECIES: hypothetical protein [Bradyrhizobium]|uniref:DUF3617 family protein n=1 Tax=Bradyrhizobium brasilense TaxID=1419277 RepID=A0ABY8JGJ7_9BRAD|nr:MULTISPECIES: hypothetical protein [Bradyrhizobium]MCP1829602.1 hypothetical protein [Bradyrhizobium sp. USDA 4545]MCP1922711.1 hypothetical protein [Bradyrhizobium sp. USDA 4532]NLS71454.1 hypothetical protein [Bradyrhizobium brasilense]OMI04485.1 hypothetical protein BSN85_26855 [Bradyrhizobium brasilense]WFU64705.1 hypothetical protein QA636_03880 [Bradyrhizobium brasilense]
MPRATWRNGGAALLGAVALSLCHTLPLGAMEILGQAGVLGEWELTGHLTESAPDAPRQFSGPLKMKHVGICTQDGPDERAGEIKLQITGADSQVTAELVLDGAPCTYSARKTRNYEGTLSCEGRAPVPLLVWLK